MYYVRDFNTHIRIFRKLYVLLYIICGPGKMFHVKHYFIDKYEKRCYNRKVHEKEEGDNLPGGKNGENNSNR